MMEGVTALSEWGRMTLLESDVGTIGKSVSPRVVMKACV